MRTHFKHSHLGDWFGQSTMKPFTDFNRAVFSVSATYKVGISSCIQRWLNNCMLSLVHAIIGVDGQNSDHLTTTTTHQWHVFDQQSFFLSTHS